MAEQNDFWTRYSNMCLKCKVFPLQSIIKHMKGTKLSCLVEQIRSEHWQFLLSVLSVDNSLTEVCFKSELPSLEEQIQLWKERGRKKDESYPCPYGYSPHNISDICKYSSRLLTTSQNLRTLIIENLPVTKEDAIHLAEGLKSSVLVEFGLRCYPYSNDVIETVCRGLWDSNVLLVDFSDCNLSYKSLNFIQNVVVKQNSRRTINAFPDTLRYGLPVYEEMMGLKRIVLNGNNIGDKGVKLICEAVTDDRGIHALDFQSCGITNEGAKILLDLVNQNKWLQVVDVRLNQIDRAIVEQISIQLGVNSFGMKFKEKIFPLWKPKSFSKSLPALRNKLKTKVTKKFSGPCKVMMKDLKNSSLNILCEMMESKETTMMESKETTMMESKETTMMEPKETTMMESKETTAAKDTIVPTVNFDDIKYLKEQIRNLELTLLKEATLKDSFVELIEKLKSDNLYIRQENESLRAENYGLRQEILRSSAVDGTVRIDKETYNEIKHVFEKFHRFLKLMKDNGLWGLVSTIGVAEYENTRLSTESESSESESRLRLVEEDHASQDECPSNEFIKAEPIQKQHRYCSCGKPDCISNQKSESKNLSPYLNHAQKVTENKPQQKYIIDKSKVTKVFKELRETYTNCDFERPVRSHRKQSLEDMPSGVKSGCSKKPLSLKPDLKGDIPNKFKQIRTRQDLYEAVKSEMDRIECACHIHKSPNRKIADVDGKSYLKNVSSQTSAVKSLSNYKCRKVHSALSGSAPVVTSQELENQSNGSHSCPEAYGLQTLSQVAQEWEDRAKKNLSRDNIETQITPSGAEGDPNAVLIGPKYFRTWATSKAHEYLPPDPLSKISKEPIATQGISRNNSSEYASSFTGNSVESHTSEQEIKHAPLEDIPKTKNSYSSVKNEDSSKLKTKTKSSQSSSNLDSLSKSYLESVSDASTDKDVESITLSEIAESVVSNNNNKNSEAINQTTINESVVSNDDDSVKNNQNSEAINHSSAKPGATDSVQSVSSSKSSKKSQKRRKNSNASIAKERVSSSSLPSLNDITTVSSNSLNTDLVMDQLSESEKDLN